MHTLTTHHRTAPAAHWVIAFGALVAVQLAALTWGLVGVCLVAALVPAAVAADVDARVGRLPDRLVLATALPSIVVVGAEVVAGRGASAAAAAGLGAVLFAGPLVVVHLASPPALGFGDVKLAAALGLALGLVDPRLGLLALSVASGVTVAVGLVARRRTMPLGPGLVFGATVTLVLAGQLGGMPRPWR